MLQKTNAARLLDAARISGNKNCEMVHVKDLLPLTGYIRGGCSPIGMKKPFPTFIHESAMLYDSIYVSAWVRGLQLCIAPDALIGFVGTGGYPLKFVYLACRSNRQTFHTTYHVKGPVILGTT